MGTNFYFCNEAGKEVQHIGKRSAAGMFCWDCGISLAAGGQEEIHMGKTRWLDECPVCGAATPEIETLAEGAAGRELGFNKGPFQKKIGVKSCASFRWAISPGRFCDIRNAPNLHIRNEYEDVIDNFQDILKECPIMFFDSIGQEFS